MSPPIYSIYSSIWTRLSHSLGCCCRPFEGRCWFYIWSVIICVTVINPLTKGNEREGKVQLIGSSPLLTKLGQLLKAGAWRRNRRGVLLANSLLGLCLPRSSIQSKTTCPWSSDTHGRLSPFTPTKKVPPPAPDITTGQCIWGILNSDSLPGWFLLTVQAHQGSPPKKKEKKVTGHSKPTV